MKYRFSLSKKERSPRSRPTLARLKGRDTLSALPPRDFCPLSDPEPYLVSKGTGKRQKRNSRAAAAYRACVARVRARKAKRKERLPLPLLAGLCLGVLTITVATISVFLLLTFAPMARRYTTVTVPDLTGKDPLSFSLEDVPFNFILQYEENPEVSPGLVISQTPKGGVVRRLYSDDDYPDVVLTVSRAPTPYALENLVGLSLRDAELILKNHSMAVSFSAKASSEPSGTVLSTDPPAGTPLYGGDRVTLLLSRGAPPKRTYVPELLGLSESAARDRLQYAGLTVGTVQYKVSAHATGTVIEQQYPARTMLEANSEVSLWVSLGDQYEIHLVPDLYGRSEKEAAEILREYGLTVGSTYTVGNAAPKGTVISQSPLPGTPLTSSVWSVDLYVSSS